MHDRPDLGRRCVAPLPRPPREHLGQPVPGCDQRLHRRHRRGKGPSRRPDSSVRRRSPNIWPGPATRWCVVGDENYGEGSSREHAAMEPRYRGGLVILARSFARIHETNLKKQGLLPLTFADPSTYEMIGEDDRISVLDLASLAPDTPVRCRVTKADGSRLEFSAPTRSALSNSNGSGRAAPSTSSGRRKRKRERPSPNMRDRRWRRSGRSCRPRPDRFRPSRRRRVASAPPSPGRRSGDPVAQIEECLE